MKPHLQNETLRIDMTTETTQAERAKRKTQKIVTVAGAEFQAAIPFDRRAES